MSDPLLILASPEVGDYLETRLRAYASDLRVEVVQTKAELRTASIQDCYQDAACPRLIAFCTNIVVPADVLRIFRGGSYNFHPGSPEYPGSNAASFAIYDGAISYGATAHKMDVTVDSGPIVGVEAFVVPADVRFLDLEIMAFQHLLNLFNRLAPELVMTDLPLPTLPVRWGARKTTRQDFERMKVLTEDMSEAEIRLRWRAFG
ncbi:MAG: hypothetical protein HQ483_04820 [Rhodospirillales bacterium]|nr:hypothetical protein [Rhodospirillales bacterium]